MTRKLEFFRHDMFNSCYHLQFVWEWEVEHSRGFDTICKKKMSVVLERIKQTNRAKYKQNFKRGKL